MSQEATVLMLKGVIFDLPPAGQEAIKVAAEKIRIAVAEAGVYGSLALGLVAGEVANL